MDIIKTYPDEAGEFRWNRAGANNEIMVIGGDGYTRESDAYRAAIRSLEGKVCVIRPDGRKVYFNLVPVQVSNPAGFEDVP